MWSRLTTSFDPEEETANFGTRLAIRAKTSNNHAPLYDVVTHATFETDDGNGVSTRSTSPRCVSACAPQEGLRAVALDVCLHVLPPQESLSNSISNDEGGTEDRNGLAVSKDPLSLVLASKVSCLCWSPCSRFLMVTLASGQLQALHWPSRKILPPITINGNNTNNSYFIGCFFDDSGNDLIGAPMDIILVQSDATIFKLSHLDLAGCHEAVLSGDLMAMKSINERVRITCHDHVMKNAQITSVSSAVVISHKDSTSLILGHFDGLICLDKQLKMEKSVKIKGIGVSIVMASSVMRDVLFCLTEQGRLVIVCLLNFVVIQCWQQATVEDIVLMEDTGNHEHISLLMKMTLQGSDSQLQLRRYPGFELLYDLSVEPYCHLMANSWSQDTPMFVEGTSKSRSDHGVDALRIRGVSESVLDARLDRLIRRKKFNEAVSFATSFKLDIQKIEKARVSDIMERLSNRFYSDNEDNDEYATNELLVHELEDTLRKITDHEFVVRSCLSAVLPRMSDIQTMLQTAQAIIQDFHRRDDGRLTDAEDNIKMNRDLMTEVSLNLKKLDTFAIVFIKDPTLTCEKTRVNRWLKFNRSSLTDELRRFLSERQVKDAVILWRRHKGEVLSSLSQDKILELLTVLNTSRMSTVLKLQWLRIFVPDVLALSSDLISVVVLWTINTSSSMEELKRKQRNGNESKEMKHWPLNAVEFVEGVLKCLVLQSDNSTLSKNASSLLGVDERRVLNQVDSQVHRLIHHLSDLRALTTLHDDFGLRLALSHLQADNGLKVVFVMLDWCREDELIRFVDTFLKSFLQQREINLTMDALLFEFLCLLIEESSTHWWSLNETASWQNKAETIINFIHDKEKQLEAILKVCLSAPIPWSSVVKSLCTRGENMNHSMASKIGEQRKLVKVKQILCKYNCYKAGVSVHYRVLINIVRRIFVTATLESNEITSKEAYDDALILARSTLGLTEEEVDYEFTLHNILRLQNANDALAVVRNRGFSLKSVKRMVYHLENLVNLQSVIDFDAILAFIDGLHSQLTGTEDFHNKIAFGDMEGKEDLLLKIDVMRTTVRLQMEFRIHKTKRYQGKDIKGDLSDEEAAQVAKVLQCSIKHQPEPLYGRLKRLSHLLKIKFNSILLHAMERLGHEGCLNELLHLLNLFTTTLDFNNPLEHELKWIQRVSTVIGSVVTCGGITHLVTAVETLSQLLDKLIVTSKAPNLLKLLDNKRWIYVFEMIAKRALRLPKKAETSSTSAQPLSPILDEWRPNATYSDTVVVSVQSDHIIFLNAFASCLLSDFSLEASSTARLIERLKSLSFTQLALSLDPESTSMRLDLCRKILAERRPDLIVGLSTAVCWPTNASAVHNLNSISRDFGLNYSRLVHVATLGITLCRLHHRSGIDQCDQMVSEGLNFFLVLLVKACWGKRAKSVEVNFDKAFSGDQDDRIEIKHAFFETKDFNVRDVQAFCRAFALDMQETVVHFVKTRIKALNPFGREDVDVDELKKATREAMTKKIDVSVIEGALDWLVERDVEGVKEILFKMCLHDINPYYYEVLSFMVQKLVELGVGNGSADISQENFVQTSNQLLGFLVHYSRIGPASKLERGLWLERTSSPFPSALASMRLPLTPLVTLPSVKEKFRLIEYEMGLDNYAVWMEVSSLLPLQSDTLCMKAVTNTLEKGLVLDADCVERIFECLQCIRAKPIRAVSTAHYVVTHLPSGRLKLLAAEKSEALTRNWHRSLLKDGDDDHSNNYEDDNNKDEDDSSVIMEAKRAWLSSLALVRRLRVELMLSEHNLLESNLMYFLDNEKPRPSELVKALFAHASIFERSRNLGQFYPDIHTVAEGVCEVFNLDIAHLKCELLHNWLPRMDVLHDDHDDQTVVFRTRPSHKKRSDDKLDPGHFCDQDVLRLQQCLYLAQTCESRLIAFLLKVATTTTNMPSVNNAYRLRALQCLLCVASESLLHSHGADRDSLLQKAFILGFLDDLEQLNLPMTESAFSNVSKIELVETLMQCRQSPRVVHLLIRLLKHFKLFDQDRAWASVLKTLVDLDLRCELESVLEELNGHPQLWHLGEFERGWRRLIDVNEELRDVCPLAKNTLQCL